MSELVKDPEVGKVIWAFIKKGVHYHNNLGIDESEVRIDMKVRDVFPTVNEKDEQANRFAAVMFNTMDAIKEYYDVTLYLDYEARSEFQHFQTLEDVFTYFYGKLTGLDKLAMEIEFE
jgi:hypothetical protein